MTPCLGVTHLKLLEHFAADPAILTLIRDGEHRLARPQDLQLLRAALMQMGAATA